MEAKESGGPLYKTLGRRCHSLRVRGVDVLLSNVLHRHTMSTAALPSGGSHHATTGWGERGPQQSYPRFVHLSVLHRALAQNVSEAVVRM